MGEEFFFNLLFSAFLTFIVYSFPIFLIRYVFLRRTVRKKTALKIVIPYGIVTLFLVKFIILATTGDVNNSASPSVIWGTLNYYMLIGFNRRDRLDDTLKGNQLNRKYVKKIRKEIKKVILPRVSSFYRYPLTNCFEAVWMAVYDALGETDSINSQINIRRDAYLLLITATNNLLNSGDYQYNTGKLIPLGESILAVCDHSVNYARNAAYITEDDDLYKSARQTLDKMGYINKGQQDIDYVLDTQPSPILNNIYQEPSSSITTNKDRDTLDKAGHINEEKKDIDYVLDTQSASILNNPCQKPLNDIGTHKARFKKSLNIERKFKRILVLFSLSQIVIVALIITVVILFTKVDDLDFECQYQKNQASYWFNKYTVIQKKYENAVNDYNEVVDKYNAMIDLYKELFK